VERERRHDTALAEYAQQRRAFYEGEQAGLQEEFERARRDALGRAENAARDDAARQIARFESENKQYIGVHPEDTPDIASALARLGAINEESAQAARDRAAIPGVDNLNAETGTLHAERAVAQRECREGEARVNKQKEAVRQIRQDVAAVKATAAGVEAELVLLAEASQLLISHSAAIAKALVDLVARMPMPVQGQGIQSCYAMTNGSAKRPPDAYQNTIHWLRNFIGAYPP
jgi:hypothetical protein